MKIRSLSLRDFRSYESASISGLNGFNFVCGPNGAGKSTILDAIAAALTGTCRGADTGRSLDELRRIPAEGKGKKWELALTVERAGQHYSIVRREGEGPRAAVQSLVDRDLGIPASRIRACLYSGELLRLDRKDAQRLLLDLCGEELVFPVELQKQVLTLLGRTVTMVGANELDGLYQQAYEARAEASRALKALTVPDAALPPDLAALAGRPLDEIEDQAEQVKGKLARLRIERDELLARVARAEGDRPRLEEEIRAKSARLAEAEKAAKLAPSIKAAITKAEAAFDAAAYRQRTAEQAHADACARRDEIRQAVQSIREQIEQVKSVGPACPTCSRTLTKEARSEMLAAAMQEQMKAEVNLGRAEKLVDEARRAAAAAPGADKEKAALAELRAKQAAAVRADEARTQLAEELAASRDALAALDGAEGEPLEQLREKAAAIEGRIAAGGARLEALTRYLGALQGREAIVAKRDEAEARHAALSSLCALLGPGGLRAQATGGVGAFEAVVEELLRPMGFDVDLGPLVRLEDDPRVNGRPARLLSSSELIRFGVALQIAIARASGLGIVAVDDWDRLDPASAKAAQGALAAALADGLDQVLVFSTLRTTAEEYSAKAGAARGIRFYLVNKDAVVGSRVIPLGAENEEEAA